MTSGRTAVLLMAYGAADGLEDIPRYLRDIRGGAPVSEEMIRSLTERYKRIGGASPLVETTLAQADALQTVLGPDDYRVYAGMRHSSPGLGEVLGKIVADGHDSIVAAALTPYNSKISLGAYFAALDKEAAALGRPTLDIKRVRGFHDDPLLIEAFADRIGEAAADLDPEKRAGAALLLTAHSLPERIKDEGDPYPVQVEATARLVAEKAGFSNWHFAYQSRPEHAREPWLGPDAADIVADILEEGVKALVVSPVGFVSDHLETLYDVEIVLGDMTRSRLVQFRRAKALNTHPKFIAALAAAVRPEAAA